MTVGRSWQAPHRSAAPPFWEAAAPAQQRRLQCRSRPPIGQEPGNLSIYEWQGYEAAGTKAQKAYGMTVPGKSYVDKYGADSLTYTAFPSDDIAVNKVAAGTQFDLMHPCISYVKDWTNAGLIQPFDVSLLSRTGTSSTPT